jgi:hypothetical protein
LSFLVAVVAVFANCLKNKAETTATTLKINRHYRHYQPALPPLDRHLTATKKTLQAAPLLQTATTATKKAKKLFFVK